jgi:hypothetical protein
VTDVGGLEPLGRWLIVIGVVVVVVGAVLVLGDRIPFLGRLPGDIRIERPGFVLILPIGTMILVSVLASVVLALLNRRS